MTLDDLKSVPLLYVATPYSRYPMGHIVAFYDACRVTAALIKRGLSVFSPIAHSHAICDHGHLPHLDHDLWMKADEPMMHKSDALLVVRLPGWDHSDGISKEIRVFNAAGKPVHYLDPETLELVS
jgi:hypothetical protein